LKSGGSRAVGVLKLGACLDVEAWNLELPHRPSVIELGSPFSQLLGVFHGRSETFSDSVVAQPESPMTASEKASSSQ
jgi:hypothetical protein